MGFSNAYKKASDRNRALNVRVSQMRTCILQFSWLANQRFSLTYHALANLVLCQGLVAGSCKADLRGF